LDIFELQSGETFIDRGRPATHWFGVVEGLLKMSSDNADGHTLTFAGVPPGGWFGEGTVLKREAYRYNIQTLRKSCLAGLQVNTFHCLDAMNAMTARSEAPPTLAGIKPELCLPGFQPIAVDIVDGVFFGASQMETRDQVSQHEKFANSIFPLNHSFSQKKYCVLPYH
jgi:hypothetical protein